MIFFLLLPKAASAGFIVQRPLYIGLSDGLVGSWSFDGPDLAGTTAYDRSGQGNNGTLTSGPVRASGKIGQALEFDGVNDYVDVGTPSVLAITGNITLSAWVNVAAFPTGGANQVIFEKGYNGTNEAYFLRLISSGGVWLECGSYNGSIHYVQWSISGWSTRTWHHIVCRFDGSTWKVYFDGVEKQSLVDSVGPQSTNNKVTIGARDLNGTISNFFNGSLDDVRIYNRALSAAEIKRLYKIGGTTKVNVSRKDTLQNGLVGIWTFDAPDMADGQNFVTAYDRSGQGNNGLLYNTATSTVRTRGKIGQALSFDGSDDYANLGTPAVLQFTNVQPHTISAWIKINSGSTGLDSIVAYNINPRGWTFSFDNSIVVTNGLIGQYYDGTNFTRVTTANNTVSKDVWHHVVYVRGSGNTTADQYLYVDGVDKTVRGNNTPPATINYSGISAQIGDDSDPVDVYYLNGLIDDVRIYNRALSAAEIKRLYKIGGTTKVNVSRKDTLQNGLVGSWSFDAPDLAGTVAYDRSGQGNNGTLTNGPQRGIGKIGQGLSFDGVDDWILVPNNSQLNPTAITVSAWVNLAAGDTSQILVNKDDSISGVSQYFLIKDVNVRTIRFRVGNGLSGGSYQAVSITSNTSLVRNRWYHVAGTSDGSTLRLYINGQSDAQPVAQTFTMADDGQNLSIGSRQGANTFFNGSIDDVRIYNRALSADEIKRLFQMGR